MTSLNDENLSKTLTSKGLAQFGDALLNFAYSVALTETRDSPRGIKVPDKVLADAAIKAGLRKHLPRRVNRGEVANSLEALVGQAWLRKMITLEEVVACLKTETFEPSSNFAELAKLALSKLGQ